MFRIKIGLVAAALVLVLVIVVYLVTVLPLSKSAKDNVNKGVVRANSLVVRSQRLQGFDLLSLAEDIASQKDFIDAIQEVEEKARRVAIFDSIQEYDKKLKSQGRKAHFFGVVDKSGAIIARDLDPNNMYGDKLSYLSVKKALQGQSSKDIWLMKNRMMRGATAPIKVGTETKGAVVIAYEVTAADAREERSQFGTHVAYFIQGTVRASSFSMHTDENTENSTMVEAMTKELFNSPTSPAKAALANNKASDILTLNIQGEEYLAITGPLPVRLTEKKVGYVVLSSLTKAAQPVTRVRWMFLVLGIGMLLLIIGGMWGVAHHFVTAEDKLELGVAEVINGNTEFIFSDVQEFEGLANALNVMLNRLLGRPELGEDGDEDPDSVWRADVLFVEELDSMATGPDVVRQLAAEPEEQYYSRVFEEYVAARTSLGHPVEGITLENLTQKLKANESMIKAKHECHVVRFAVNIGGGKVSLTPVRIG